MQENTQ